MAFNRTLKSDYKNFVEEQRAKNRQEGCPVWCQNLLQSITNENTALGIHFHISGSETEKQINTERNRGQKKIHA
jgi:hypothetical protein